MKIVFVKSSILVQFHVVKFTLFAINFVYAIYILEVREYKMENKE